VSKPILVGYEPKARDRAPVRFAVAVARFTGARLIIACVAHGAAALERLGPAHIDEALADRVGPALDDVVIDLGAEDVVVETRELRALSAARALHDAAEAEGAGLLVVGSATDGLLGRVLPGSTVQRLMHGAPCPIAIVPQGWQPRGGLTTIAVAYVDSEEGRAALHEAHVLARRAGATLRVLSVVRTHIGMYAETEATVGVRPAKSIEEVEGEHRVRAEQALRAAVAELDGEVPIEAEAFVDDDPAEPLIRVSRHVDLLICGSRGYGPARAVLLGGVTRRLTSEANCPVVVLARGVRASLQALIEEAGAPAAP
jgi:nucleotide-binding universal stress UspA family protein